MHHGTCIKAIHLILNEAQGKSLGRPDYICLLNRACACPSENMVGMDEKSFPPCPRVMPFGLDTMKSYS